MLGDGSPAVAIRRRYICWHRGGRIGQVPMYAADRRPLTRVPSVFLDLCTISMQARRRVDAYITARALVAAECLEHVAV